MTQHQLADLRSRPVILLLIATLVVGVSILASGAPAKVLNGIAGIMWFAAAAWLVWSALQISRRGSLWCAIILLTAVVAFVVRPSDLVLAALGFLICGALAALVAGDRRLIWPILVVALYLPMHIGTAVFKAVVRSIQGSEASLRTDPPPTAALVPLVMLIAAIAGGLLIERLMPAHSGPAGLHSRRG